MSVRLFIAGFLLSLLAALAGCSVIVRSRVGFPGVKWIIGAVSAAIGGVVLFLFRGMIPEVFSVVLGGELIFLALVLLHKAVLSILNPSSRYFKVGSFLLLAHLAFFLLEFYGGDSFGRRVVLRTLFYLAQEGITAWVLLREKSPALRTGTHVLLSVALLFCGVNTLRILSLLLWPPTTGLLQPDMIQALFGMLNCVLGLCLIISVLWLAFWAKKYDLQTIAFTDVLTGLLNRRAFEEAILEEMRLSRLQAEPLSLLLIDVDRFKKINDDFGHLVGDEVLRQVGAALKASSRSGDFVCRYGGEEFAVVLRKLGLHGAEVIAERLRGQVEAIQGLPHEVSVTVSIGVSVLDSGDTVETFLQRSDDALYSAKRSGRNCVNVVMA